MVGQKNKNKEFYPLDTLEVLVGFSWMNSIFSSSIQHSKVVDSGFVYLRCQNVVELNVFFFYFLLGFDINSHI